MNSHQLNWMIKQLQIMSTSLGGSDCKSISMPRDDFESARIEFTYHLQLYEKQKASLSDPSSRLTPLQQIQLRHQIRDSSIAIKKQLKHMISSLELKHKQLDKLQSKNKKNEEELTKLQEELHYKELVLLNCQRVYTLLFQGENKEDWGGGAKTVTFKQLLKQNEAPLLDDSDSQGDELILDRIKLIDDYIESQLDEIIEGVEKMNRNARLISEALEKTHQKIVLNVRVLEKNMKTLEDSNAKAKRYLKHCQQSYCLLDVVLVVLLGVLVYVGYKQFYP